MATMRATTVSDAARLDPHPQRAGAVEGPGEHLVAGVLGGRQRLAGDGGLVHVACARQHLPVRGDPLARPDQDHVADPQARRVHGLLAACLVEPGGLVGREVEQAAHGLGGAVGGHRLQGAGGGEDDDQQPAVQHLPDRCRADRRDAPSAGPRPGSWRAAPAGRPAPAPSRRPRSRPGRTPTPQRPGRARSGRRARPRTARWPATPTAPRAATAARPAGKRARQPGPQRARRWFPAGSRAPAISSGGTT